MYRKNGAGEIGDNCTIESCFAGKSSGRGRGFSAERLISVIGLWQRL